MESKKQRRKESVRMAYVFFDEKSGEDRKEKTLKARPQIAPNGGTAPK
jgi:hypothetical protein